MDNMPQPDAFLYVLPAAGGQVRIAEDGYIEGAPELIVEIASSSASHDLHEKLNAYRRNGVREYVVWRVLDEGGRLVRPLRGPVRTVATRAGWAVPKRGLPRALARPELALIRVDRAALARADQQGLASPEHAAFVERFRAAGHARP